VNGSVLIAGGYGVVGEQIAEVLRDRHAELPLTIAGRNPERGAALAERIGAACVVLDVGDHNPLRDGRPAAVIGAVNDRNDHLLMQCVRAGIPYMDITRWTSLQRRAALRAAAARPTAPVLLASAWMAGVAPLVACHLASQLDVVDTIEISILYALADRSGSDSIEYVDRMTVPFETTVNRDLVTVRPLTSGRTVEFHGGKRARVYRIDTPEQTTLPLFTGAKTVNTRIGYDSATATVSLQAMRITGLLRLMAHPRLTALRRSLLHSNGEGGTAQLTIEVTGGEHTARAVVSDPRGQSHLTAIGAAIGLERLLGLDGVPAEPPGVRFPEQHPDPSGVVDMMCNQGISVAADSVRQARS
jgi:saccharopine dehydrogenase-like NADP-dependent oxidoreductase